MERLDFALDTLDDSDTPDSSWGAEARWWSQTASDEILPKNSDTM